ncbi:hypothetical protein IAR50_001859 [Cryptococcus sp. DSM 104548]
METEEALPGPSSRPYANEPSTSTRRSKAQKSKRAVSTSQSKGRGKGRAAPESETAELVEEREEQDNEEGGLEDRVVVARREEATPKRPRLGNKATRRIKALRNAERFVHIPPVPPPPNPSTDLLQVLHHQSSQFYSAHSLLYPPVKRQRAVPWASKKRLKLARDRSRLNGAGASGGDGEMSEDGEEIEDILGDQEEVSASASAGVEEQDGKVARGARGKYKVKDMYKAIEGEGLMAMGILVQEHIIRQLEEAGYQRPTQPEEDESAHEESDEEEEEEESDEEE